MNQIQKSKIAFIQASWHPEIVEQSYLGFEFALSNGEIVIGDSAKDQIDRFHVPGSLEIPLQAKLLAKTGKYAIIVAAGLIVDGGIYRHDFVAKTVLDAMMKVQLASEIPILSLVLTPNQFQETEDHIAFFSQHFYKKGAEAAQACIETLLNLQDLRD
jgi:6,7-dimethyl-8-ribityllumazine synthase